MKRTADVVIIGGGCMGASTAYHLTRLGITDVVIVEREPMLATGSTGRNAGGVRHQFSNEANVRLSIESISLLERFKEEVGYEIDFHQHGYLFLLTREQDCLAFRKNAEMQRRLGVTVDLVQPEEAGLLVPGLDVQGVIQATFCGRDGIADPNGVTMGFAKQAQARGAVVYKETEVTGIKLDRGRVASVETSAGSIATPAVVNAAGPHAATIGRMAGIEVPVAPYRRHIFITEPIELAHIGVQAPSNRIMVIDFASTFYFHREGPGILFGMSDPDETPSFDLTVNWELLERLTPIAVSRLPLLETLGIAHAWAGLYEVTPDAMPIIGAADNVPGFFMINGFSGHGFQHSPAAGRMLADLMTGKDPADAAEFSFERFSTGRIHPEAAVV